MDSRHRALAAFPGSLVGGGQAGAGQRTELSGGLQPSWGCRTPSTVDGVGSWSSLLRGQGFSAQAWEVAAGPACWRDWPVSPAWVIGYSQLGSQSRLCSPGRAGRHGGPEFKSRASAPASAHCWSHRQSPCLPCRWDSSFASSGSQWAR